MLIRSQDKETLVNINRLTFIMVTEAFKTNGTLGIFVTDDVDFLGGYLLGEYSSQKKSKKVLDMIEKAYKLEGISTGLYQDVFQMPEDEEVPDV